VQRTIMEAEYREHGTPQWPVTSPRPV